MNIRFREPFACKESLIEYTNFSPDGQLVAYAREKTFIEIKNCLSQIVCYKIQCSLPIDMFEWSPDGSWIYVLMRDRNALNVYFVENQNNFENKTSKPSAFISGGTIIIDNVKWSPDPKYLLIIGQHASILLVWNFNEKKIVQLSPPKNTSSAFAFSPDGSSLAVLAREKGKDVLLVYNTNNFKLENHFDLSTLDSTTVQWSLDGSHILVIDSISHHLLQIISMRTAVIKDHSAYDGYLGIVIAEFSKNSKQIAVGGFDDVVRILITGTWTVLAEFIHNTSIRGQSATVYAESSGTLEVMELPIDTDNQNTNDTRFKYICWSPTNKFLATVTARMPNILFIWNSETISLVTVVIFQLKIQQIEWSPNDDSIAACTNSGCIFISTPTSTNLYKSQSAMTINNFRWSSDGKQILIIDNGGTLSLGNIE